MEKNNCEIHWQFQSCQVTWAGDTCSGATMSHGWVSVSNNHNWPEFYPGLPRSGTTTGEIRSGSGLGTRLDNLNWLYVRLCDNTDNYFCNLTKALISHLQCGGHDATLDQSKHSMCYLQQHHPLAEHEHGGSHLISCLDTIWNDETQRITSSVITSLLPLYCIKVFSA